jgi:large subunit ribosomal protein L13
VTPVRRNALLLATGLVFQSGMIQLAVALGTVTIVAVTGVHSILGLGPAVFLVAGAIAVGPAGRLSDRVGRMPVIRGGFLLGIAGPWLTAAGCATRFAPLAFIAGGSVPQAATAGGLALPRGCVGGRARRGAATISRGGRLGPPFLRRKTVLLKTYSAKPGEITRDWYLVDAEGKTLGRLATQIADRLRGKGKPQFTPHVDTGDFVVVVNAEKIAVTGNKLDDKMYYRHSGYPGGLRERTLREQLERQPTEVLRKAVKGMLPRNRLGRAQLTKLKIYAGPDHPHEAQAPTPLEV